LLYPTLKAEILAASSMTSPVRLSFIFSTSAVASAAVLWRPYPQANKKARRGSGRALHGNQQRRPSG
jgi:hypothetical protein